MNMEMYEFGHLFNDTLKWEDRQDGYYEQKTENSTTNHTNQYEPRER